MPSSQRSRQRVRRRQRRQLPRLPPRDLTAKRGREHSSNFGTLYYLDANGKLAVARVKTGINDGSTTEITGKTITEGMKVIAGTITPTTTAAATSTAPASPFQGGQQQQQQQGAQRGGGRGGF